MKLHLIILLGAGALLTACSSGRERALHEYGLALECMDNGDAPEALEHLERADEMTRDDSLQALVHSQMGSLYLDQGMLKDARKHYHRAMTHDATRHDTLGLVFDLRDLGNVCRAGEEEDSCVEYFTEARRLALMVGDTLMANDVESQLAGYWLWKEQPARVRPLLMKALAETDEESRSGLYFMAAELYRMEGRADSAEHYYRELLAIGTMTARQSAHRRLADYCMARGQQAQASQHLRRYEELTDSLSEENDAESMRRVAALYDYTRHRQQAERSQRLALMAGAAVVVLLLAMLAAWIYASRRRKVFRLRLEQLELLLETKELRKEIAPQDQQRIISQTSIYKRIHRLVADDALHPLVADEWAQLEDTLNKVFPDFARRVEGFCRLNTHERRVCQLLKIGIAPGAIAELTAHTRQSVSNTRSRLYEKAFGRKGAPAEWDAFIASI